MKILVLVRHGQSEANVSHTLSSDPNTNPLTQLGITQVQNAKLELRKLGNIELFFTSPVLRARQTCKIISEGFNLPERIDNNLAERGFGEFEEKKYSSSEELRQALQDEMDANYVHGMENWDSLKNRMKNFMEALPDEKLSVAVSHRGLIAAALGIIDKEYDDDKIPEDILRIGNASITVLSLSSNEIIAVGENEINSEILDKVNTELKG